MQREGRHWLGDPCSRRDGRKAAVLLELRPSRSREKVAAGSSEHWPLCQRAEDPGGLTPTRLWIHQIEREAGQGGPQSGPGAAGASGLDAASAD